MSFHRDKTGLDIHVPNTFEYADSVARLAAVGFVAGDVGKWAFQVSDKTYWRLDSDSPITWVEVTGGGGGAPQTPWLQDIDAARFDLSRVGDVGQAGGDPTKVYTPTQVSVTATGLNPRFSVVQANYLYVCDANDNDLRIYDVTDSAAPALVGSVVIGGGRGVDVAGRYVYYTDEDNGGRLVIVDVENKSNPVVVGSVVTGGSPRGVKVRGTIAVVTYNSTIDGMRTFDVSDPTAPVQLDTVGLPGAGRTDLDIQGTIVAVPTSQGVRLFDISDPNNILILSTVSNEVDSCKFQGRYLYTANEATDEFEVWDVVNPSIPVLVGQLALAAPASVRSISVSGDFAYFVDASNDEMRVVDISDPTAPAFISTAVSVGLNPIAITTVGRYAYVLDNNGDQFFIFDLSGVSAQNLNVGNIDAGNMNLRKDLKMGGVLSAVGASFGTGGIFSDGDVAVGGDFSALGNADLGGFLNIDEIATPANPAANEGRLYAKDDGGTTKLFFLDSAGVETDLIVGFGDHSTRTQDDDADGFDLFDLANLEFRVSTVTPAVGTPSIYHTAIGLNFDVPTGDGHIFQVNGALEYDFDSVREDFNNNRIVNLGRVELSTDTAPAATDVVIWADVDGMKFNVDGGAGEDFQFQVSGGTVLTLTNTSLLLAGRDIEGIAALEFQTGFDPGSTISNIHTSPQRMVYNVPTGLEHRFAINGIPTLELRDTEADFEGNNLVNVSEIHSATGNLPVLGFLKMDDGAFLGWRNVANTNDNVLGFSNDELQVAFDSVIRYAFTDAHLNLTGRNLFDTGVALFGTSTAPAATALAIWTEANGMRFNVAAGDNYEWSVNGVGEMSLDSDTLNLNGNDLIDVGRAELFTASAPAASDPATWWNGSDFNFNAPTGAAYKFDFNGLDAYVFGLSQLDLTGRDLINAGNTAGRGVATKPDNVVQVFTEADFPDVGGFIVPTSGIVYEVMNPITITKRMKHPTTVSGFDPATIRTSVKQVNIVTVNVGVAVFLDSPSIDGQLVFQNIILQSDGLGPFAHVVGNTQTGTLTELDDAIVQGFLGGTFFDTCIFNVNNESFWSNSGTFDLIDVECNVDNAFNANFVGINNPAFRVRSSSPGASFASFLSVRDSKLSSQTGESFFFLHNNLVAGSNVRLNGVDKSPFTPGNGTFFGVETGSITALADSGGAPGVRTLVFAPGHDVADGDTVVQSGFVTETQMNGTFVASNIVSQTSYEVVAVFSATDTGSYVSNGLDETDPKVSVFNNPGQQDSRVIGSFHVNSNVAVTVITALGTYTDLNLDGGALAGSNIERWSLTNTTTGELTYNGLESFSGTILAQLSTLGETGSPEYRFRAVKNGAVLPDNIETVREAGAVQIVTTGLVAPVSVVTGDTIRLQVNNIDDANDITITHLSVSIQ